MNMYDRTVEYILENNEKFYRLAYSYVKNKECALDVVQNSIVKGLEKCEKLKNPDAIKTWFYRIIVNEALMYLRKIKREQFFIGHNAENTYYEDKYEDNEVYGKVQKLPEKVRTVIVLHFYEELTLKEISEVTDTNINTVKSRLYSGLEKLRKDWGIEYEY